MPRKIAAPQQQGPPRPPTAKLMALLKPYKGLIVLLAALTIVANGLNLVVPKLISRTIDSWTQGQFHLQSIIEQFVLVALGVFILTYAQTIVQTYASERVAKDLR